MDRFIVDAVLQENGFNANLKSSMDRFIVEVQNCDGYYDELFKIQYG